MPGATSAASAGRPEERHYELKGIYTGTLLIQALALTMSFLATVGALVDGKDPGGVWRIVVGSSVAVSFLHVVGWPLAWLVRDILRPDRPGRHEG